MSWARPVIAASLIAFMGAPAAFAAIVVASSGPSASQYPAGKKLDDAGRITLQKGDSVTVLDKRGTRVLSGPGRVAVSPPGRATTNTAFAMLTRQGAAGRARTGAVRGVENGLRPNIWYVDLSKPGTQCISSPDAVGLWRADTTIAARYRIASAKGGGTTAAFAAKEALVGWDRAKAPLTDGATYTITREGGSAATYKFVLIPTPPTSPDDLAQLLIANGCTDQVEVLWKTLKPQ